MSNVCCKEFKGWCKSFTKLELLLSALEALLLAVFIALFVFVILHLLACSSIQKQVDRPAISPKLPSPEGNEEYDENKDITTKPDEKFGFETESTSTIYETTESLGPNCTWVPSQKSKATTHYYENDAKIYAPNIKKVTPPPKKPKITVTPKKSRIDSKEPIFDDVIEGLSSSDVSDGEDAEDAFKGAILALVKLRPPRDVLFGCILTVISRHWTLTAASCIESIEEVDSLDSFVMMENYGGLRRGSIHAVSDVQLHPQYQGSSRTHDLAALRTDRVLTPLIRLPTVLDYFLLTIGEQLTVLGYGRFRTIEKSEAGRGLREARVSVVPATQCPAARREAWAARHLEARAGGEVRGGAGCAGARALCAGALYSRGTPCTYCSGAPLLAAAPRSAHASRRLLLGVMAHNPLCAVTCEPALYVNLAALRDWIDYLVDVE